MMFVSIFSMVFYCNRFFEFKIVSSVLNGTLFHETKLTGFEKTDFNKFLRIIHVSLRDVVGIVALLILNGLIIKSIQNLIKNKRYMIKSLDNDSIKKLMRHEKKLLKMIIIANILNIILHTPICFFHFQSILSSKSWYYEFSRTFVKISYLIGFFFYLIFNKIFRDTFFVCLKLARLKICKRKRF